MDNEEVDMDVTDEVIDEDMDNSDDSSGDEEEGDNNKAATSGKAEVYLPGEKNKKNTDTVSIV